MTQVESTPQASLNSEILVGQWHEILQSQTVSGLSDSVLQSELHTLVDWIHESVPAIDEGEMPSLQRVVEAGEQLVELGIDSIEKLATAQGVLASWLSGTISTALIGEVIAAFSNGAYRALRRRADREQLQTERALAARMDARTQYSVLVRRLQQELSSLSPDQETPLIAATLSMLCRELRAEGAGLLKLYEGRWTLQQAQNTLPSASFIQPVDNSAPPLFEDGRGEYRVDKESHQFAIPVLIDPQERALLFLVLKEEPIDSTALLDALTLIAQILGTLLNNVSLRSLIRQQASNLRTMESASLEQRWGQSALRQMGVFINEDDETQNMIDSPNHPVTIEPQRVVLPLTARGEAFGKLMLEDDDFHDWSEDELELMNVVAEQMSQALEVARLFQESERRSAQLEAAAEVSRAATSLLSVDDLMTAAVEQIRRAFGYYHAQVFLVDDQGQWAVLRSSTGEVGKILLERGHKLAVGSRSIIGQVTSTAQSTVIRDTDTGGAPWHFNELLPETRAELAVPLKIGSTVIGALDVQSTSPDVFYEDDVAVLQTLADQMSVAIQNARAFEQQRESAEQLRELDKLKSQFLANMSHELRTPLNSIIGFSRVILKGIDGPVTDLQRKDLGTIYNSGQILLQLIDSILDISKIEAGKMELDFEDVNLQQVVDVAYSTALGLVKDKPVELLKEVPDDLPTVRADPVRLRQVLLNLFSNASKFTEQGHIRLTVTRVDTEILLSVSDTGLGIPPDKQAKLFEAFYQVDGSATRKIGGTGLGLAITKSFIEMHGGQIWVESTGVPGEGTTFAFTIPIDGPPEEEEEQPEIPLILAIDDEPGITGLYERYLRDGYRFVACNKAVQAAEEAGRLEPQLILLDLRMPEMNGFEVIKALRQNIVTRDIPVVICSVEAIENIEQQGLEAGASDFLQKPVLRQDLITTVQRWTGVPAAARG
ncbi:MAG: GAF domain-containing protein [Ardenticatenales bacterium]|nr:GAF domain-containing protein [Ardenticatenales bacterium]